MASNLRPRKAWLEIMICLEAQSHRLPLFDACIACDGIGPRYLPFCKSFFLLFSSCKSLCIFLFLSSTRAALAAANCILSYACRFKYPWLTCFWNIQSIEQIILLGCWNGSVLRCLEILLNTPGIVELNRFSWHGLQKGHPPEHWSVYLLEFSFCLHSEALWKFSWTLEEILNWTISREIHALQNGLPPEHWRDFGS
jgi:hypothetical protein